jgi:hypothetical protein
MDIEFHYYMTYLVAARSGLSTDEARTVAHASQYIDDNDTIFEIDKDRPSKYSNYISQTMNILKPKPKLFRIYPIFHFIPGDPKARTAWRRDGKMHWLNTTPNSENANRVVDAAIASKNLHRIGVSTHGYADTWAHQNFVGYWDDFNAIKTPLGAVAPNIGHADAGHNPDEPALVWQDKRLIDKRVDNRARFLEAASHTCEKLCRMADPGMGRDEIDSRRAALQRDLDDAIGERDQENRRSEERIVRYRQLALSDEYGGKELPVYDEDLWMDDAVAENVRGLRDRSDSRLTRWDPWTDQYTWRDRQRYKDSDWYRFQEGVKEHQDETWGILEETTFKGLVLPEL